MIVYAVYPLAETRVQREAEALLKHGYEVDVICLRDPGDPAVGSYKGVSIYRENYGISERMAKKGSLRARLLSYLRFFLAAAVKVTRLHLKKRFDTIQVHNLPDFLIFSALIPKLIGSAVILDIHDLMPEFFAGRFGQIDSLGARLIRFQERLACRFADHVITVSEQWRQVLIERGLPANKCSVVMNVADESIFCPPKSTAAPSPSQNPLQNSFRLIYHGGMYERYGLDLAIRAIHRLRQEIPGIHLTLIGWGEFLPKLHELVVELDLSQYVAFELPHLAEELPGIIRYCNLGIVPYRNDTFTDGLLPTKLMEYVALGKPAIAARTTAIQAYFSGTNTEFFEPGNVDDLARVITSLYHNPDRLDELARGCQKFNQQYNWTKIGAEYVSLVKRLGSREESAGKKMVRQNPRNTTK